MGQTNVKNLGNGGTMDGDVTITGDLTVSGGIGLSLSEVIEGTSTIDVTNTEAFLVRKNGDGGDIFTVDTNTPLVKMGGNLTFTHDVATISSTTGLLQFRILETGQDMLFDAGGDFKFRDTDDSNATRLTIASGTGNATFAGNIRTGTSVETANTNFDNLVIEGSSHTGISIFSGVGGSDSDGGIYFGDDASNNRGQIKYAHGSNSMSFTTDDTTALTLGSDQSATFTQSVDGDAYIALDNVAGAGSSVNETSALRLNLGDGSTLRGGAKITAKKEADYSTGANMDASLMFSVLQNNAYNDAMHLKSSGNLGLGVSEPGEKLAVADGNIEAIMTTAGAGLRIIVDRVDTSDYAGFEARTGGSQKWFIGLRETSDDNLHFYDPNGTAGDRLVLDSNSRISLSNNDGGNTGNTIFGKSAWNHPGDNDASDYNTIVGELAMGTGTIDAASNNTGIGYKALTTLTTGDSNTAIGSNSGHTLSTGIRNTFIGNSAGYTTVDVDNAVFIGYNAGAGDNITDAADGTIAIGVSALLSLTSGVKNTAVGYRSLLSCISGGHNTVVGYDAGEFITTGNSNTFVGAVAGQGITGAKLTGNGNTAIGKDAGLLLQGAAANNIFVGAGAGDTVTTGTTNVVIGADASTDDATATNQIVIGANATGKGSNTVTLGDSNVTDVYMNYNGSANIVAGQMEIEDTAINKTTSYTGLKNSHTKTTGATDSSDDMIGLQTSMTFNDADAGFSNLMGIYSETHAQSAGGENTTGYGLYNRLQMSGSTDVNTLYGEYGSVDVNAGTVDGDIYGKFLDVDIESGCTIGNDVFGFRMDIDADTNPSGGVTSFYMRLDGNGDKFIDTTDVVNSTDRFEVLVTGVVNAEGTINASQSMDYAEYFESKDGKEIAVGTTVKLDGNKIVACSDGDTPLGVIRPKSGNQIVGGGQMFHWEGMFMKDDYGANIWEDYTKVQWTEEITLEEYNKRGKDETGGVLGGSVKDSKVKGSEAIKAKDAVLDEDGKEIKPAVDAVDAVPDKYYRKHKYHSDRLPDGVTAPKDAKVIKMDKQRQKLNPDYDVSKSYQSREKRTGWHIVGLLGQIPITKGQPVASHWIKMNDVSDKVEMYFVK